MSVGCNVEYFIDFVADCFTGENVIICREEFCDVIMAVDVGSYKLVWEWEFGRFLVLPCNDRGTLQMQKYQSSTKITSLLM